MNTFPTPTFTSLTQTPVVAQSIVNDVVERLDAQTFNSLGIQSAFDLPVELTCSSAGGTAITYSISQYLAETIPVWVTLDSVNSKITGTTPALTTTTTYNFYIDANSAGWGSPKQKRITLVVNCYSTCEVSS